MNWRALSCYHPWALLMALGEKTVETRSYPVAYRGPLVICSTKQTPRRCRELIHTWPFLLEPELRMDLPAGAALCVVELVNCLPVEAIQKMHGDSLPDYELSYGDYSPGRYAWVTCNLRRLRNPVPVSGYQSLWKVPPELQQRIEAEFEL